MNNAEPSLENSALDVRYAQLKSSLQTPNKAQRKYQYASEQELFYLFDD